jgi:hypothetical protein
MELVILIVWDRYVGAGVIVTHKVGTVADQKARSETTTKSGM